MPWTFAHPAAVLPLRRLWGGRFPFAAMFIGSLTPDAFYYGGRFWLAVHAHSVLGWFWLCLPVGLVCYAVLRALERPLIALLPDPHRAALLALPRRPCATRGKEFALVCAGIVLGAATHGIWDSMTHSDGYIVEQWDFLRTPLFTFYGHYFPIYNFLQHASTVIGSSILAVAYLRFLKPYATGRWVSFERADLTRYAFIVSGFVIALGLGYWYATYRHPFVSRSYTLVRTVVYTTTLYSFMICTAAMYLRIKDRRVLRAAATSTTTSESTASTQERTH